MRLNAGNLINGGGVIVLGQQQDSLGGSFGPASFMGTLSGVNLWNQKLSRMQIVQQYRGTLTLEPVLPWKDFILNGEMQGVEVGSDDTAGKPWGKSSHTHSSHNLKQGANKFD